MPSRGDEGATEILRGNRRVMLESVNVPR